MYYSNVIMITVLIPFLFRKEALFPELLMISTKGDRIACLKPLCQVDIDAFVVSAFFESAFIVHRTR
jgi:hypothetical protein